MIMMDIVLMKNFFRFLLLASFVILLCQFSTSLVFADTVYTYQGILQNGSGAPISDMDISLSKTGVSASTVTLSDGSFSLQVPTGTYNLNLSNQSNTQYSTTPSVSLTVSNVITISGDTTQNLTLPTKQLTITVVDVNGQSVTNSDISVSALSSNVQPFSLFINGSNASLNSSIISSVNTGNNNAVTVPFLPSSTLTIKVTPPSDSTLARKSTTFEFLDSSSTSIALPQTYQYVGILRNGSGTPIPNMTLAIANSTDSNVVYTGSDGSFVLRAPNGTYDLTVAAQLDLIQSIAPRMLDTYTPNAITINNGDTIQNLVLPTKLLRISVLGPNGELLSNTDVRIQAAQSSMLPFPFFPSAQSAIFNIGVANFDVTNNLGVVSLAFLPSSSALIKAFPPSGSIYAPIATKTITITNDQNDQYETIVVPYSHGIPTTTVALTPHQNTDGTYPNPVLVTLSAVAASGYSVANTFYTVDGGSQQTYSAPFTVSGSGDHAITYWSVDNVGVSELPNTRTFTILTTYTLSGTVYNDANQNGFQDTGESGYTGAIITLNTGQTTTSGSNGNYTFSGLAAGTYTETLTLPNGYTATTTNPATISFSANTTQNFGVALAGPTLVLAINAGGDTQGSYLADTDFTGGILYTSNATVNTTGVINPAPEAVYQSVRYGNFSYTVPNLTPNGIYTVRLHFNELYWGTALSGNSGGLGSRVFNVSINGTQVLSNYDIYQKVGGSNIATTEQFPATPDANGNVTIQFITIVDNAMVNGIELYNGTLPSPTPTPTPTPSTSTIINTGGSTVGSFVADKNFSGGTVYSSTASVDTSNVTNPAPEAVYQSVRYGNFTYTIPDLTPNTNFLVRLHFNELYWGTPLSGNAGGTGSRIFNVSINGQQVLSNFDIFATVGGANKALVKDLVKSSDGTGKITIQFTTVTDNAMVNGIEIIPPTVPTPTYFTANDGTDFSRLTSPFVSGVAIQMHNADGSVTMSVNNTSSYADSGFVLYKGTLGNLPNFTTVGTGDQYGLNLWLDTNNNNEFFAWDSNGILTGLDGDTYALSSGSQNGVENINGTTNFFLMSDGQNHSLTDLKNGAVSGINVNTKVAVWMGVNTNSGSTSSTIQSVNGL